MIYPNAYYFIGEDGGCCFNEHKQFVPASNDWSSLIGSRRYSLPINFPEMFINKDAVCFITSFQTGLHAFVGVLSIINKYLKQENKNKNIVISENLQPGIVELIHLLVEPEEVITLRKDQVYRFKSLELIPNSLHSYFEDENHRDEIVQTLNKAIPLEDNNFIERLAILKHSGSGVSSKMGEITLEEADSFCNRLDYKRVEPSEVGEVGTIKFLRRARKVVFSWGTTFMKNFIYVSDACQQIDVFIFGPQFANEYRQAEIREILPKKYKNATIIYHHNPNLRTLNL